MKSVSEIGNELAALSTHFEEAIRQREQYLKEREDRWEQIDKKIEQISAQGPTKIVLDVGGKRFATSKSTLLSVPDTFFTGMLCSDHWKPNDEGAYFIDRNPKHFGRILDFLRSGTLRAADLSQEQMECLQEELDFYQIHQPTKSMEPVRFIATIEYDSFNNNTTVRRKRSGHAQSIRLDKELTPGKSYEWTIRLDVIKKSYWIALGVGTIDTIRCNDIYGFSSDGVAYPNGVRTGFAGDWLSGDLIQVIYKHSQVTITNMRTQKGYTANVNIATTMYPFFDIFEEDLTITIVNFKEL